MIEPMKTVMVAHRGAQLVAPENTLAAFKLAIAQGYRAIECDVQLTSDGHLVVIHDETVDRTTDGKGWVSKKTLDQIQRLRIEDGEHVPTLQEVYYLVVLHARRKLIIEIKGDTELHAKKAAIALGRVLTRVPSRYRKLIEVHSFWYDSLVAFKPICPDVKTAAIIVGGFSGEQIIEVARRTNSDGVSLGFEFVSPKIVRKCHKAKLFVDTWAISDATVLKRLKPFGINAFVENFTGNRR